MDAEHSRATKSAILTPEEMRKARQWEIETGEAATGSSRSEGANKLTQAKQQEEEPEEKIVMSSTSYPGWDSYEGGWDGT